MAYNSEDTNPKYFFKNLLNTSSSMRDINPKTMIDHAFEQLLEKLAQNREKEPSYDYYLDPAADLMSET